MKALGKYWKLILAFLLLIGAVLIFVLQYLPAKTAYELEQSSLQNQISTMQVQISENDVVNGRAFPTMLIWLMLAMSALLVGREAYNMVMHRPAKTKTLNLLVEVKALVIVLILVVTYLLAEVTDLFVVGAVFCAVAFLLFFRCKKPLYYAITVSMAVLIWVVFHFVLNVSF